MVVVVIVVVVGIVVVVVVVVVVVRCSSGFGDTQTRALNAGPLGASARLSSRGARFAGESIDHDDDYANDNDSDHDHVYDHDHVWRSSATASA
jgi:hypothetical protein